MDLCVSWTVPFLPPGSSAPLLWSCSPPCQYEPDFFLDTFCILGTRWKSTKMPQRTSWLPGSKSFSAPSQSLQSRGKILVSHPVPYWALQHCYALEPPKSSWLELPTFKWFLFNFPHITYAEPRFTPDRPWSSSVLRHWCNDSLIFKNKTKYLFFLVLLIEINSFA